MSPNFENTAIAFRHKSNKELKSAQFLFSSMGSPLLTRIGMGATGLAMKLNLPIEGLIKRTIYKQFCGGETMAEAGATAALLVPYKIGVILDYGVEGKEGEDEFDAAVPEFIRAITFAASQEGMPFISIKVTGFARFGLLEKMHGGEQLTAAETEEAARVRSRIDRICASGAANNIMVLIDAEESWIQQPVDDLADAMMEQYNRDGKVIVFNTFQMYRHDRLAFLRTSMQRAKDKGYLLGAKLVRGAYMEKERRRADEKGYASPIQPDKQSSDRDYDAAVAFCLDNLDHAALFIGTHNEQSCLLATQIMEQKGLQPDHPHVWFSQLYGMSDNISFNLADAGYRVAKYLPYGPVRDVIPYLMRRAQENTSVKGQTGRELALINNELRRRARG